LNRRIILWIAIGIVIVWALVGSAPVLIFCSPSDRGSFGDMFGAVNALFSGLALAGVICAILLQREELSLQRKELELTRAELKRSAEAQAESSKTLIQQCAVAERNVRIQALTALLQSCSDKFAAERARIRDTDPDLRVLAKDRTKVLEKERAALEEQIRRSIEMDQGRGE
jgi:hypothetical protein